MSFQLAGLEIEAPVSTELAPLELFKTLFAKFKIQESVATHVVEHEGFESLGDFICSVSGHDGLQKIIEKVVPRIEQARRLALRQGKVCTCLRRGVTQVNQQTSRLQQAWMAAKLGEEKATTAKRKGFDEADLDNLLSEKELSDIKDAFWTRCAGSHRRPEIQGTLFVRRYKTKYPIHVEPADQLVSRLTRELKRRARIDDHAQISRVDVCGPRRQLSVFSVWDVRSLTHQLRATRKKRKIADNLEWISDDRWECLSAFREVRPISRVSRRDEASMELPARNLAAYIANHFTLMLAYGRAGGSLRALCVLIPAPGAQASRACPGTTVESAASDSTLFVEVRRCLALQNLRVRRRGRP